MKPLVSVVIPCYNAAEFVQDAIGSVLNSTYKNFEIIVVDDGSTDGTAEKVNALKDERIRYFYKENTGVAHTRNIGIGFARGEYIAFLDADDMFLPNNLKEKVDVLDNDPECGLVHAMEERFFHESGASMGVVDGKEGYVLYDLLEMRSNVIHSPSSVVCRKQLLEELNGFDTRLSTSADWELWVRIAARGPIKKINKTLSRYRLHKSQMHMNTRRFEADTAYAYRKLLRLGYFKSHRHYNQCFAQRSLILSASYLGIERNIFRFVKLFMLAVIYHPPTVILRLREVIAKSYQKR
jgi:glycosyltransferase involved in cell wall biosynthesis